MKVLFVSWRDTSHPLAGGSETLIDRLATGLHDRGHDVHLLAGTPVTGHPYSVTSSGGRFGQYWRAPVEYLRRHRDADLVVDVANGLAYYSPLWRRRASLCFVNHVHTDQWSQWFNRPTAWFGRSLEAPAMPSVYRDRLFCAVSPSTAAALADVGVPEENIRVVYNGVEAPALGSGRRLGRSSSPLFVSVGRLVPHKRYDLMLNAWREVRQTTPGHLVLIGDGPQMESLRRTAPPDVTFAGRVTDDERDDLLARAWALVHPAQVEGWGLVVMEAAIRGTPTIGFDVPGVRDSVVDGETGVLADDPAEFVRLWKALATDRARVTQLGVAAERRAAEFTWDRTTREFEAVAKEALDRAVERVPAQPWNTADDWQPALADRLMARARPLLGRNMPERNGAASRREILRLFLAEKHDPEPFYRAIAERSVAELPHDLRGSRILDLGCSHGYYAAAMAQAGARVAAVDMDWASLGAEGADIPGVALADGTRLPYPDACFDGVVCSNMLEHTPDPDRVFTEIARVLRPGGWGWISWTNWYSPWGGHEIVPFHLIGPRLGLRVYRRLFGEPRKNVPFEELWPTHIGPTLRHVQAREDLELVRAEPRYYRSQRWIVRVPGLREFASWNCLLHVVRSDPGSDRR